MNVKEIYKPEKTIDFDFDIRFDTNLTNGEKIFYAELRSICSRFPCRYNKQKLAELFNVSNVSINSWVKKLCKIGYIEVYLDKVSSDKDNLDMYIKLKKRKN